MKNQKMNQVYVLIAQLADARGVRGLSMRMPPYWVGRVDQNWTVAVSGADVKIDVKPPGCMKAEILPGYAAIWFNGWLAGILGPRLGSVPDGELANEKTLTKALLAAIKKETSVRVGA